MLLSENVKIGKDDTIYSMKEGIVQFNQKQVRGFDGQLKKRTIVNVV
jgi:ribosomal protein L27